MRRHVLRRLIWVYNVCSEMSGRIHTVIMIHLFTAAGDNWHSYTQIFPSETTLVLKILSFINNNKNNNNYNNKTCKWLTLYPSSLIKGIKRRKMRREWNNENEYIQTFLPFWCYKASISLKRVPPMATTLISKSNHWCDIFSTSLWERPRGRTNFL